MPLADRILTKKSGLFVVHVVVLGLLELSAQNKDGFTPGARAAGMGYAASALHDGWAMAYNVAGIAREKDASAGFGYNNRFSAANFNTLSAYGLAPMKHGVAGIQIMRFGDPVYSEHQVTGGFAHRVKFVSIGLQATYYQVAIEGLGAKGNILLNFGGIADLTDELSFGASIYNINQAKLAEYKDERIPTVMKAGISYHPGEKVMFNAEVEKDIDYRATIKAGLEYKLLEQVQLRTGIQAYPFQNHFGASFMAKRIRFDYALATHSQLGASNHISLVYRISDHEKK